MKKPTSILLVISALLIGVAIAIYYFGPEYDRSLLPPATEEDFFLSEPEPVGGRWIILGTVILCLGMGLAVGAMISFLRNRLKGN
jgi:hypothetical protein